MGPDGAGGAWRSRNCERLARAGFRCDLLRMRYCLILLALLLTGAAPVTGVTETRRTIGAYELVERTHRLEPGEVPIMHIRQDYSTLALSFGDAAFNVSLVDTGQVLSFEASGTRCGSSQWPLRWQGKRGEPGLFRDFVRFVAALQRACTSDPAVNRAFVMRLRASRIDFIEGVEQMKARAVAILGPLRNRCRPSPRSGDSFDPCRFHGQ